MKRPRPNIPLSVRVAVAERQVAKKNNTFWMLYQSRLLVQLPYPLKDRLEALLFHLFKGEKYALDHDPALILRPFDGKEYDPPANSVKHLVYRTYTEHLQKTIGRKMDAAKTVTTKGSDIWLKSKFARLENTRIFTDNIERQFQKPKKKIQSRGFPKVKRPFPKRRENV